MHRRSSRPPRCTCDRESSMPRRRRARRRLRSRSWRDGRPSPGRGRPAARRAWSPARHRSSWNAKSLAGNGLARLRRELLDARQDIAAEPLDGLGVDGRGERGNELSYADSRVARDEVDDLRGCADEGIGRGRHPMRPCDSLEHALRFGAVLPYDDSLAGDRLDLARVTADVLAVLPQHRELLRNLLGGAPSVPHVGVARSRAQRALLASATDQYGQPLLDRAHQDFGILEVVELAVERDPLSVHELANDLRRLGKTIGPFAWRAEIDSIRVVLESIPGGADSEDRASPGDVVECRGHVRENGRVPVRDSSDEAADAGILRDRGVRGLQLPALEVRPVEIAVDRIEVVPHPERIEPESVRKQRVIAQGFPRRVLWPEVDAEMDGHGHPVSTLSPCPASLEASSHFSSSSPRSHCCGRSSSYWAAIQARPGRPPFGGPSRAI